MSKSLYIIIGTPGSGLNVLSKCLNILGITPLTHESTTDANTINHLLLQDLGVSPYTPALPKDWLHSNAATLAKARIEKLLSLQRPSASDNEQLNACPARPVKPGGPLECFTGVKQLGTSSRRGLTGNNKSQFTSIALDNPLLLNLWNYIFKKYHISPKYLLMLRHPWEVALTLSEKENLDLQKSHILWLAHSRAALQALKNEDCSLITYDQLIADPVSTLHSVLEFSSSSVLGPRSSDLLEFVRPGLKHHHAADLPEQDKHTYKPYEEIYNQLRLSQYSALAKQNESAQIREHLRLKKSSSSPAKQDQSLLYTISGQKDEFVSICEHSGIKRSSSQDLIDNLLQALAQQERTKDSPLLNNQAWLTEHWPLTTGYSRPTTGLHAKITLPSSDQQGEITQTFSLLEDQWQRISLPIPPDLLKDNSILVKPLNTIGTVRISAIKLLNKATGQTIWSATLSQDFDKFEPQGQALRLPDHENFKVLITGVGAFVQVHVEEKLPDCPIEMEMWVKAGRGLDELYGDQNMILGWDDHSIQQFLAEPWIWSNERHVHALNVLLNAHKNIETLQPFLPSLSEKTKRKIYRECMGVDSIESAYQVIMKAIADDKTISFADAVIEYIDERDAWICIDEILIRQEYFFDTKKDNPKILDCGSNIGISLYYFKHMFPNAKILAFEPVPALVKLIHKNIARNNWNNIAVYPYAIDGVDGDGDFYISKFMTLAGTLTDRRKEAGDELEKITVQRRKLSHYLTEPVDYLKLDIEGSEDSALIEAAPLLGNVQHIFCEYHHGLGMETDRLKKILDILDNAGFDYHVSKSAQNVQTTSYRPMKSVRKKYSALIFAKNKDWKSGQKNTSEYLKSLTE